MKRDPKKTAMRVLWRQRVPNKRFVIALGLGASLAILAYLVFNHIGALWRISGHIEWRWFAVAVGCALASYVMVGLALAEILSLLGYELSFPELLGIALVSTTANYFVSSAGVSGFALKAHLLRRRGVPYGITVTASVLSSAILYIVLAAIIGQGLGYLILHLRGTKIAIMESALGLVVLLGVAVPLLVFFFNHKLRSRIAFRLFHWLNHVVYFFSKSEIPREDFQEFEEQLASGLENVRRKKLRLTKTIAYTCLDWGLAMTTLYFTFRAIGLILPVGHLSAGFTAGQAATLIPILPGGLGAVEGSMAAVFESLGLDWENALVAVLLYRLAYYFIPGLISIFVLWGLKVSEPALIENTVLDVLPEELRRKAASLEISRRRRGDS